MSGTEAERAVLAGEYVLGLLDAATAAAVRQSAAEDPAMAELIVYWQERLDPLAEALPPVPPTDLLWARIAAGMAPRQSPQATPALPESRARLAPPPPSRPRARGRAMPPPRPVGRGWRALALTSMALAAGLAAFIVWSARPPQRLAAGPEAVALLTAPGALQPSLRVQLLAGGVIAVAPLQPLVPTPGRQMAFWGWPHGQPAPVLLGMLAPEGGKLPFHYPPGEGTPVMITSEPLLGQPKTPGPTLYAGLLTLTR